MSTLEAVAYGAVAIAAMGGAIGLSIGVRRLVSHRLIKAVKRMVAPPEE